MCSSDLVTPVAVRSTSPLGSTGGVTNLVEIVAEPVGRIALRGPGAGGPATASAVVADLLAIARGEGSTWDPLPEAGWATTVGDDLDVERAWLLVPSPGEVPAAAAAIGDQLLAREGDALITRPLPIDLLRRRLLPTGVDAPLYPVIPEA